MTRNTIAAASLAGVLLACGAGAAAAQNTDSSTTMTTEREEQDSDYSWIGLLGLAGLAGLIPRKREVRHVDTTPRSTTTAPRN